MTITCTVPHAMRLSFSFNHQSKPRPSPLHSHRRPVHLISFWQSHWILDQEWGNTKSNDCKTFFLCDQWHFHVYRRISLCRPGQLHNLFILWFPMIKWELKIDDKVVYCATLTGQRCIWRYLGNSNRICTEIHHFNMQNGVKILI